MEVTVCDEQVAALAASVKGEETEAPLAGLLMVTPLEVEAGVPGSETGSVVEPVALLTLEAPQPARKAAARVSRNRVAISLFDPMDIFLFSRSQRI